MRECEKLFHQAIADTITPLIQQTLVAELQDTTDPTDLPLLGLHFGGAPYAEQGESWPTCQVRQCSLFHLSSQFVRVSAQTTVGSRSVHVFLLLGMLPVWRTTRGNGEWVVGLYSNPRKEKAVAISDGHSAVLIDEPEAHKPAGIGSRPESTGRVAGCFSDGFQSP